MAAYLDGFRFIFSVQSLYYVMKKETAAEGLCSRLGRSTIGEKSGANSEQVAFGTSTDISRASLDRLFRVGSTHSLKLKAAIQWNF